MARKKKVENAGTGAMRRNNVVSGRGSGRTTARSRSASSVTDYVTNAYLTNTGRVSPATQELRVKYTTTRGPSGTRMSSRVVGRKVLPSRGRGGTGPKKPR